MASPIRARIMATKMNKNPLYSNVRVAQHYDTVTFNYRNVGRFQLRFFDALDNGFPVVKVSGYYGPKNVFGDWRYDRNSKQLLNLQDYEHMFDMYIDNVQSLYRTATPKDED